MFSLFLALKYLKPKRAVTSTVTVLSIFGVMLGVAIVIIVRAVFTGFGATWEEKILSFKPHITVQSKTGVLYNEQALCRIADQIDGITAVSATVETRVLVEYDNRILAPILVGADAERAQRLLPIDMVAGSFDLAGEYVVIGIDMARQLGCYVGDELLVYSPMNLITKDEIYFPERLRIKGIFDTGRSDFDSEFIFVSLPIGRDLTGMNAGANSIFMKVESPQDMNTFGPIVETLQASFGPNVSIKTWQQMDATLFNALATEKNMMMLLLMFISVVAVFCVVNTLIVMSVQKTSEIGLLKALGFSTRQLMMTFVLYGWIQCFIGTLLGIGVAFAVLCNLQYIILGLGAVGLEVFPKEIYGLSQLPWHVSGAEVAQVGLLVILFCTLASFIPAWRAASMDPVAALRKE